MQLVDNNTFLRRLEKPFEATKDKGTVWLTHKQLTSAGEDAVMYYKDESNLEYLCLVLVTDGKKTQFSTQTALWKQFMMELVVIKGSKHDNSRKNRRRQVKAALKLEALNEWAAKREGSRSDMQFPSQLPAHAHAQQHVHFIVWVFFTPGEAGMKGAGPATGSYSLKIEGDVSESHVFQQRNVSESKIVTERERTNPPSHPSHSENEESPPNLCVTHATIDPPSVVSHVSISDSSVQKLSDNPSPVPPGTKLRPRRSSIISKVSSFFQRLKSLRGTQEKGRASPVIVQAATFNNVGPSHYAIPGYGDNR
ncbi:hypothetical protein PISMIDRAFT_21112 [Pisolithus microcarpus 441]|uniref:Uncharacterized protein n=1 Tax=Pisolithus microcarpus 441 TaxID=765257 RepID=A0A0C9ZKA8_9AGAM|nr:hypothetical protein BKA83DRAFT_21112 [Pisolithus microcarpus]KIK29776.1 hypothetical protein PISMIDRAFT_21112 [Pisolithus microcarpus 441]